MLQDLEFGRLENEYRPTGPLQTDPVLCFRGPDVLLYRDENDALTLPTVAQLPAEGLRYAFRLRGTGYHLLSGEGIEAPSPFTWENARGLRRSAPSDVCFAVLTGWHLHVWYRSNRFCGRCGAETVHDDRERMLRCPACGNLIFPRINPVVIAAVTDGDRLLLSRYAGRSYTSYALLAGYTEIGETLEQTVAREVMEEVGLKVKDIRYFRSQPWGYSNSLLSGYFCHVDGSSEIRIDEDELSEGVWYTRDQVPEDDTAFSLTWTMIRRFRDGLER